MNTSKKRIIYALLVAVLVAASATVGTSIAYLSKNTEQRANTFLLKGVAIDLIEDKWDALTDTDKLLYPAKSVDKDPCVKNNGTADIYVFIEVVIPRRAIKTVTAAETIEDHAQPIDLFTYQINSDWVQIGSDQLSADRSTVTRVYGYKKILSPGQTTQTLFDKIKFVNMLEGTIPMNTQLTIPVNAYAIQTEALSSAGTAYPYDENAGIATRLSQAYNIYKAQYELEH